jgi:hypothetical protein
LLVGSYTTNSVLHPFMLKLAILFCIPPPAFAFFKS